MKIYLAKVTTVLKPKNRLESEIQRVVKSYNRIIYTEDVIEEVKHNILKSIENLNKKHPRCAPVNASFWSPPRLQGENHIDYKLDVGGCIHFSFLGSIDWDICISPG